jgi:hypothetical protein
MKESALNGFYYLIKRHANSLVDLSVEQLLRNYFIELRAVCTCNFHTSISHFILSGNVYSAPSKKINLGVRN